MITQVPDLHRSTHYIHQLWSKERAISISQEICRPVVRPRSVKDVLHRCGKNIFEALIYAVKLVGEP